MTASFTPHVTRFMADPMAPERTGNTQRAGYTERTGNTGNTGNTAYGTARSLPVQSSWQPTGTAAHSVTPTRGGVEFDNTRYWVGAMLTSVVAALAAVVGLVAANGIVGVPVLAGAAMSTNAMTIYGLASAGLGMAAALLYFAMLKVAPRPTLYYGWIIGLITVLAVLVPFTTAAVLSAQVALAGINLIVGLVVLTLMPFAADNARLGSR